MANTITAGNGTNNGLAVTSDGTGALNILTGSGSGTAAISIDSSQNVTAAANLAVTGNVTVTGTLSATNGVTGSLKSATAQASTSGTSIDFTSIPSGVKRITVMFNGVSTNGTSIPIIQLGAGSFVTTGYLSYSALAAASGAAYSTTTGVSIPSSVATNIIYVTAVIENITGTNWLAYLSGGVNAAGTPYGACGGGSLALGGTLDRIRITTVNGTDTFDAGSINIIYE